MSALLASRLPRLDSDLDSSWLARPERRNATSRLRREYTKLRNEDFQDDQRIIRERIKFANQLKLARTLKLLSDSERNESNNRIKRSNCENGTSCRSIWNAEITKRNVPSRPMPTVMLRIATPRQQQTISARYSSAVPVFRNIRVAYSADRERTRMHFVSPEWTSEHVSRVRFYETDLKDIHKLSWM